MPELPEVESVRLSLTPHLIGATIRSVSIHRRRSVILPGDPPAGFTRAGHRSIPRPCRPEQLLQGAMIDRLARHGKQLAVIARDGRALCIHLGMSGQLLWAPAHTRLPRSDHVHVQWRCFGNQPNGSGRLVFRDPRLFGAVWAFPNLDALIAARWRSLGPDALTIRARQLHERLARTRRPTKAALLDQFVLAGVGNIYADEALFAARIHPGRPSQTLTFSDSKRLAHHIRSILRHSIRLGGTSVATFAGTDGTPGRFQRRLQVYGRAGLACVRCNRPLEHIRLAGRTTAFCSRCQG